MTTGTIKLVLEEDESFHLTGQHDQSAHGRPGGKGGLSPAQKELLKKIAIGVGVTAVAVGILYLAPVNPAAVHRSTLPISPDNYDKGVEVFDKGSDQFFGANLSDSDRKSHFSFLNGRAVDGEFKNSPNQRINDTLRGKIDSTPEVEGWIDGMDNVFREASVDSEGVTLFRGLDFDGSNLNPGDILQDNGFVSTTINESEANKYHLPSRKGGYRKTSGMGTKLRIRTNQNTKVLYGDDASEELILNRGTSIRILNVFQDENGVTVVDSEVI